MLAPAERSALYRITTSESLEPAPPQEVDLLRAAINQVDYGLLALDAGTGRVYFANAVARSLLLAPDAGPPAARPDTGLCVEQGRLVSARGADAPQLRAVLARARKGLRGLLSLGRGPAAVPVAVVPLAPSSLAGLPVAGRVAEAMGPDDRAGATGANGPADPSAAPDNACALLVFAKQQLCDESTVTLFARQRGLTNAEGQVLAQVCRGLRPTQIADDHGVRISTVRTQLRSIRAKTSAHTIRELVHMVSVLPPMARQVPLHGGG